MSRKIKHTTVGKVLVFTAHPDDHLFCAGTMIRLRDAGFQLAEVVFTGGENSVWHGKDSYEKKDLQKHRLGEWMEAGDMLGVTERITLGIADSEIQRDIKTINRVMHIVRKTKPLLIITHHPHDYHHDHREASKVVTEAVDRASWDVSKELGIPHRTSLFLYMDGEYPCRADLIVDVSQYEAQISNLMDSYRSQLDALVRNFLNATKTRQGFFIHATQAEAFEIGYRHSVLVDDSLMAVLQALKSHERKS